MVVQSDISFEENSCISDFTSSENQMESVAGGGIGIFLDADEVSPRHERFCSLESHYYTPVQLG